MTHPTVKDRLEGSGNAAVVTARRRDAVAAVDTLQITGR
jgi:hypothetical protein